MPTELTEREKLQAMISENVPDVMATGPCDYQLRDERMARMAEIEAQEADVQIDEPEDQVVYNDGAIKIMESQQDEELRKNLSTCIEGMLKTTDEIKAAQERSLFELRASFTKDVKTAVAAFLQRQVKRMTVIEED